MGVGGFLETCWSDGVEFKFIGDWDDEGCPSTASIAGADWDLPEDSPVDVFEFI